MKLLRAGVVLFFVLVATLPIAWLALTSVKTYEDTISAHAKFVPWAGAGTTGPIDPESVRFAPSLDAYRSLSRPVAGTPNDFYYYLGNSIIIGVVSTLAAVALGTICAYGFSRFKIPGEKDWLFFILSTRFLPPLAVVVPVLVMYRWLSLENTHAGLILLYTSFNLSLAVWLMKGFVDEIPRAFEEAALVDGYSRLRTFFRIIVPQASTGMAVTGVFCLISSWNEFGFAMTLNNYEARTVPVYFAGLQGNIDGVPWPQIAAGMMIFVAPIVVFTVLVRRHLLRGVTFGTIKQ
jgi:multiple sugar transport system permease protein